MITTKDNNRANNFDFLRLLLASLVIVAHSYPLTGHEEILGVLTNGQTDFGSLAVNGFFALSGYFIFLSLQRSKTVTNYIWKRLLRLYPALVVLFLFTLAVIPIVYSGNHLTSTIKNYWRYVLDGLLLFKMRYFIPGVFENNPYKGAVNGSLWTLAYEFTMYMVVLGLFFVRKKKISYLVLLTAFIIAYILATFKPTFLQISLKVIHIDSLQIYRLATYFLAGSLLTFFDLKQINKLYVRWFLLFLLIFSFFLNIYPLVSPFILPAFIIFIGALDTKFIQSLTHKLGDISYGVYIYGFLVQQIFMNFFDLSPVGLMLVSLPVTYVLAYLSWHFVEEKMLKYKDLIK